MNTTRSFCLAMSLIGLLLTLITPNCHAGTNEVYEDTQTGSPKAVYVIAIGVNKYPGAHKLNYGVADATSFAEAIGMGWKSAGVPTDVQLLTDDGFSRDALLKAFDHVAAHATADDLFVFYYAGLDGLVPDANGEAIEFCFLTGRCSEESPAAMRETFTKYAVSATLLKAECAKIQVKKQMLVVDTCHAGDKLDTLVEQSVQSADEQRLTGKSVVLLTSEGTAYELPSLKHGILTYSLLQGLAGEAILSEHFSGITAREMAAYLPVPIIQISKGEQIFHGYSWGEDFMIAPLPHLASVPPAETPMRQTEPADEPPAADNEKPSKPGRNYALIFATDHYDDAGFKSLPNPIHDAQALADKLRAQYGFEAQIVPNPTKKGILTEIQKTRSRVYGPNDQLFIFFAGHGMKGEEDSYIVARNSIKQDGFYESYYQYADLKNSLTQHPCPHIMLALDVCYGGNFANDSVQQVPVLPRLRWADFTLMPELPGPSPDMMRQAARLMKDKSRVFLSSGQDVPVPDGTPGGHSPFMEKLLDALEQGRKQNKVVTAHAVYEEAVTAGTDPEYAIFDNLQPKGDFVFVPGKKDITR